MAKKSKAAELRDQADAVEVQEQAEAEAAALAAETAEQKADRLKAEKAAADLKQLVENPTDEQKAEYVGLYDTNRTGVTYVKVDKDDACARRLLLLGKNYEHVSGDPHGRWLFAQM